MESRVGNIGDLPEAFLSRMKTLLGSEFKAFCDSYKKPPLRGLRMNLLKTDANAFPGLPVPWCNYGYIYPEDIRPAKSVPYNAGLFYIQEPSAMCPVEILRPMPGLRVLDLCAAPGGKSAQIAGHMTQSACEASHVDGSKPIPFSRAVNSSGLLVSNDASPSRSRALVKNLERAGVTNAVVLTEQPKKLAGRFPEFFDRVLVDAPCSGEGMFRRDSDAAKAYTENKPEACAALQKEILRNAAAMLKPGGRMVYSTCTFNPLENENVIADFLSRHSDFALVPIDHAALNVQPGRADWVPDGDSFDLSRTARIWPHLAPGEGHFIALLEKAGKKPNGAEFPKNATPSLRARPAIPKAKEIPGQARNDNLGYNAKANCSEPKEFAEFRREFLNIEFQSGVFVSHGTSLFLQPEPLNLRGLRVARSGWHLGECTKGRFVPSHALAMGLLKEQAIYSEELTEPDALRYLRGESLEYNSVQMAKPWALICHEGFSLGWARLVQGRLKNNLPVGWAVNLV